jgi:hypothetical protein
VSLLNQDRLADALRALEKGMRAKTVELAALDNLVNELRARARACGDEQISRLMLELRTGGNVRLEEGRPVDSWFGHCDELMQSRFNPSALRRFGVGRLVIHRVTRVHNRLLGNRYERRKAGQADARRAVLMEKRVAEQKSAKERAKAEGAGAGTTKATSQSRAAAKEAEKKMRVAMEAAATPPVEFLFMCETAEMVAHSGVGHEILRAIQHGFRTSEANASRGFHGGVVLSNSVDTCMAPRLQALAHATGHGGLSGVASWADIERQMSLEDSSGALGADDLGSTMQLMIAKVCPGRCTKLSASEIETLVGASDGATSAGGASGGSSSGDHARRTAMAPDAFPGFMSACGPLHAAAAEGAASGQTKPTVWFVKDPELVLPEYLVEFSLHPASLAPSPGDAESDDEAAADSELLGMRVGERDGEREGDIAAASGSDELAFDREMREVERLIASGELSELAALLRPLRSFRRRCRKNAAAARRASRAFAEALRLPPSMNTTARVVGVLDSTVAAARGLPRAVADQPALQSASFVYLNLHGNGVTNVRGIETCTALETLILSYNAIGGMSDFKNMEKLKRLDLGANLIDRVEGLTNMPALRELALCVVAGACARAVQLLLARPSP